MKRKPVARRPSRPSPRKLWPRRWLPIVVLVTLPALVIAPGAKESFRVPKLLLTESLGLLSLLFLARRLRSEERIALPDLLRQPVIVAILPLLVVATSSVLTSGHPLHVRQALVSLWIGAACLVGWSLALRPEEHRRILASLTAPAAILSLIAIGQFHGLFELFRFREVVQDRIGVTSLAGGAFDLGGYLVLPALYAQLRLSREEPRRRWGWGLALVLYVYSIALTQTLTAIAALLLASFVLWLGLLPWRRLVAAAALALVVAGGLAWGIGPLRNRLDRKLQSLRAGDINTVLTGRLDGWRGAVWMFQQRPWTGMGHGAYRAEYGIARLALRDEGWSFYRRQHQTYFSNAHNEFLEVAAEWGIPGCLALVWGIWWLFVRLRQRQRSATAGGEPSRGELSLMWAGVAALAVLASGAFPLRIALVAYPYLLFLSWIFSRREAVGGAPAMSGKRLFWVLVPLLLLALLLQLRTAERRWRASHQLAMVERMTMRLMQDGLLARQPLQPSVRRLLEQNTSLLRDAAELDPVEVGIPIARGSLYYLLGRPKAASRAYQQALEIEERGEIHAYLGRVHLQEGDREAAVQEFRKAVWLNHTFFKEFRPYLRETPRGRRGGRQGAEPPVTDRPENVEGHSAGRSERGDPDRGSGPTDTDRTPDE